MSIRRDEANLILTINGQQGGNTLRDLQKNARDLRRLLEKLPVDSAEFKKVQGELNAVNTKIKELRGGLSAVRQETGLWGLALATASGVIAGLNIQGLLDRLQQWLGTLFSTSVALDTMAQKTRTVFGDAEGIVRAFAESNARELGLAREQYIALATAAGDLLKPMGFNEEQVARLSVALTDQAGILAEWSQGKVDTVQAQEILTKALLGERDALNSLGIDIKDSIIQDELKAKGLEKTTGSVRRQAEALITLELIAKQSASANEAYEKNTDSLTRNLNRLQARITEITTWIADRLRPAFAELVRVGITAVEWAVAFAKAIAAIPAFVKDNYVQIGLLVGAIITWNTQNIIAAATALKAAAAQRAATIATNAQAVAQRALNLVMSANPITRVITVLLTLAAVLVTAYQNSETFRRVVSGAFEAVTQSVKNALGFFTDLGSGLSNLFTGNFEAAAQSFSNAFNRINPAQIGKTLKESFVKGYESVPAPKAKVEADQPGAEKEGAKVGAAFATGFEQDFKALNSKTLSQLKKEADDLKKFLESQVFRSKEYEAAQQRFIEVTNRIKAITEENKKKAEQARKAEKDALELRLKEIEASFLKEEIVADRALFNRELSESDHARRILELKRQQYEDQIAAFRRFHQEETKEALAAQKNLLEIQQQLAPRGVASVTPLGTVQPGQVTSQTATLTKQGDVAAADDEIKILQDKIARVVDIEQGSELLRLEMKRNALNAQLDLLRQNGLQETQEFQRILGEKIKADEDYHQKRIDNEKRTAELRKKIEQGALEASSNFFGTFADLLSQDEKLRKKNASAIKTFQVAQVIIDGISEVQKIWANWGSLFPYGPAIAGVMTAIAGARSAIAISKITNAKFAWGGYTGIGFGAPDSTGHRPVGVVHEREWVGPRWMVESPALSPVFNTLESIRRRGFADGGFSTTPAPSVAGVTIPGFGQDMMGAFMRISEDIRGLRQDVNNWRTRLKADVSYLDIEDAGTELNLAREDASI